MFGKLKYVLFSSNIPYTIWSEVVCGTPEMREKSLLEEVELLRADSWNKKDFVESMSNQVNSLKDVMKVADENLDKKNAEIYLLKEKLAT